MLKLVDNNLQRNEGKIVNIVLVCYLHVEVKTKEATLKKQNAKQNIIQPRGREMHIT